MSKSIVSEYSTTRFFSYFYCNYMQVKYFVKDIMDSVLLPFFASYELDLHHIITFCPLMTILISYG